MNTRIFPTDYPLSWSQISCFRYSKYDWYRKYILKEFDEPTIPMSAGKNIGEKIAQDPKFMPGLERADVFEQKLLGSIDNIKIIGYLDSFSEKNKVLLEYKTSRNKYSWYPKKVRNHEQLDMYVYLICQNYKFKPEEVIVKLISITLDDEYNPVEEKPRVFEVKKTIEDMVIFANNVIDTRNEMIEFFNEMQK